MSSSDAAPSGPPVQGEAPGRPRMTVGTVVHDERRRPLKTSERVAAEIVRDIVAHGAVTGARLPSEAGMVEQYHVSRTSLREALRLLEVQGLIWLKPGPGGGPIVGTVEPAHLGRTASLYFHLGSATYAQLLEAQVMLEPLCAQLAAQHPNCQAAMRPFTDMPAPSNDHEYHLQTTGFHGAVYVLAGNAVLTLLAQAVTQIVTDHVVAMMEPVELHGSIVEEHTALARAIADGKADAAGKLMGHHFRLQQDYYLERAPGRLRELVEWR